MTRFILPLAILLSLSLVPAASASPKARLSHEQAVAARAQIDPHHKVAIMKTTQGDIYIYFFPDDAPLHVRNFIYLAQKGFYTNVPFHRVVPKFVIQAGEPRKDWHEPEVTLKLEADTPRVHVPGSLAAARTDDPDSATSEFYFAITEEKTSHLNGRYTVYGQAFRGMETINKIGANPRNQLEDSSKHDRILSVAIVPDTKYLEEIAKKQSEIDAMTGANAAKF